VIVHTSLTLIFIPDNFVMQVETVITKHRFRKDFHCMSLNSLHMEKCFI
jgi:hypothetical protein